jgi:heat shock protein HtpX
MNSIYTNIAANKRNTLLFMFAFIAFASVVFFVLTRAFLGDSPVFLVGAILFSIITSVLGYYNSAKIALAVNGARLMPEQESPYVHHLVENLCIAAGLPKPKVYVIDSPALNAFATGRNPQNSAICFTSGIIQNLEKIELEGVIAHELAHIGNNDILLMTVVGVLAGSITLAINWITNLFMFGGSRKSNGGIYLILGLITIVLAPLVATVIQLAVSRNREFLADASGALLTRYPEGLARALIKISESPVELSTANPSSAHMYIASPFKAKSVAKLFATHPPVEERIKRLRTM